MGAAAKARGEAWPKRRAGGPLVVDIDSTLVEVHSENKQGAAPHYKGGYGFGPMICSTGDGEPLWAKLRPGNAAANDIADHIEVLDAAISVLPDADAAGHREGDDAALVGREMVLRVDAGGCSARIAAACRDRNITFFMSARATAGIDAAIAAARCDPRRLERRGGEPHPAPLQGPCRGADRSGGPVGLAGTHTADRATRTAAPGRAAQPVRQRQLPPAGDSSPTPQPALPSSTA